MTFARKFLIQYHNNKISTRSMRYHTQASQCPEKSHKGRTCKIIFSLKSQHTQ